MHAGHGSRATNFQLEMSNDHLPIHERKWKDISANEFSNKYTWESQISKFVSILVRHENCRDRETDGANNLFYIDKSEAQIYVPKGWKPRIH